MTRPSRIPPLFALLALPAGVVLLQWHGIPFWRDLTDDWWWGTLGSPALEWLGLWAWATQARLAAETVEGEPWSWPWLARLGREGLALLAAGLLTALAVAGPLYHVGAPLLKEAQAGSAALASAGRWADVLDTLQAASRQENRRVGEQIIEAARETDKAEGRAYGADAGGRAEAPAENDKKPEPSPAKRRTLAGFERVLIGMHLALLAALAAGTVAAVRTLVGWWRERPAGWVGPLKVMAEFEVKNGKPFRREAGDGRETRREDHHIPGERGDRGNPNAGRQAASVESGVVPDLVEPFRVGVGGLESGESPDPIPAIGGNGNGAAIHSRGRTGEGDSSGVATSLGLQKAEQLAARGYSGREEILPNDDPLAGRVTAVLRKLDAMYPGLSDAQRGLRLPAHAKDISFLRNHGARVEARRRALASGNTAAIERARVISEAQLAKMEVALGLAGALGEEAPGEALRRVQELGEKLRLPVPRL